LEAAEGVAKRRKRGKAHPESQILGSENPTQPFFLIDDQHTIRPLGRTQLTGIRDRHILRHRQCRRRFQAGDGTLLGLSAGPLGGVGVGRVLVGREVGLGEGGGGRAGTFAGEFGFDLSTEGLDELGDVGVMVSMQYD
jgi:hypothetical protein